jgi:signal transduction histidine kinase
VYLSTRKSLIYFSVKDEGPGIAEEEKNKIFEKFYRAGNEVTRTTKGTGLGLYLCKQIAKDHHATISIVNSEPHGAIFTVTFRQAGKPAERIG